MELVVIRKGLFLRLSDFVNEYDLPTRKPAADRAAPYRGAAASSVRCLSSHATRLGSAGSPLRDAVPDLTLRRAGARRITIGAMAVLGEKARPI
jgi:hypothetical protein